MRDQAPVAWSLGDLEQIAQDIASKFKMRQLVLLSGPMGAGKTTLVKALLAVKGVSDASSPTFALHHRYQSGNGSIDHIDLFRVKVVSELEDAGLWDLFLQDQGLILVEWADRMDSSVWPGEWQPIFIELSVDPSGQHFIKLKN